MPRLFRERVSSGLQGSLLGCLATRGTLPAEGPKIWLVLPQLCALRAHLHATRRRPTVPGEDQTGGWVLLLRRGSTLLSEDTLPRNGIFFAALATDSSTDGLSELSIWWFGGIVRIQSPVGVRSLQFFPVLRHVPRRFTFKVLHLRVRAHIQKCRNGFR